MSRKCLLGIPAFCITMLLTSCSTSSSVGKDHPFFSVLETRPARPGVDAITAQTIDPRRSEVLRYLILDGDTPGESILIHEAPTDRFHATWMRIEGETRELYLDESSEGHRLVTAVIEHDEKALSLFDPPLISVYDSLLPGVARRQEVAIRVVSPDNPRRLRD